MTTYTLHDLDTGECRVFYSQQGKVAEFYDDFPTKQAALNYLEVYGHFPRTVFSGEPMLETDWYPNSEQLQKIVKAGFTPSREPNGRFMLWYSLDRGRVGQTTTCWEDVLAFASEQKITI